MPGYSRSTAFAESSHTTSANSILSLREIKAQCNICGMRSLCLPVGLSPDDLQQVSALVDTHLKLKKGETLYRTGTLFTALYAVRLGSLKTTVLAEDGREQVAGYHMLGELIGLDGIGTGLHGCHAIALEDTEICVMPFDQLETLARELPTLQHNIHQTLAQEIARDHSIMLLLGSMRAEERLAVFLVNLSDRYCRRGYSSTEFVLRMTREEIGSYLGLKLETVSRLFSRFQEEGLIQVQGRAIKILNSEALRALGGHQNSASETA
ncbi:MAG: fumarate/nitrate reduction transcriptional regulator Fnr [Burkholderiales bacterium]|jgi:CRP/FNR family transcriptional regulator|nr:fumarate/nitrate reduction transcriptional regulator Fnr [Burkholderiales bacterium]